MNNSNISMDLIFKSISFYSNCGYSMIDAPMCVPEYIMKHNTEKFKDNQELEYMNNQKYVASAEQSFLYLKELAKLPIGKYMALTPCYRDNKADLTHFKIFMKLELIIVGQHNFETIIADAAKFFIEIGLNDIKIEESEDVGVWDINCKNIELGSYGNRKFIDGSRYSFGTGLAEPRTSYVKSLQKG